MKKTFLSTAIVLAFLCFSCNNEPVDFEIVVEEIPTNGTPTDPDPGNPTDPDPGTPTDPNPGNSNQLSNYTYVKEFTAAGNDTSFDTDFNINNQNQFTSQDTSLTLFGTTINANAAVIRDQNTKVIGVITRVDGTIINRASVTYNVGKIADITYEDLQDATEDFVFTFTHLNNEVTRTKEGTIYSTKFTFSNNNRLIKRETMESGVIVKTENITYDSNGNLIMSEITGQNPNTYTYTHDNTVNPLSLTMNDLYGFLIFYDEYDDQYEHWQAMVYSNNNVTAVTTTQGPSNLDVQYDASNRIISRSGTLFSSLPNISNDVTITISENFQYIN
ncbi:hypothetical protein [uncultured Kordia sp.]|uniref:hypothetical protein n=1 Tax=uncultured Kordia sp. TaxID=507699 RepID=UPI002608D555|nr:hypothetical protein [uncultured Kordia sp.]